MSHFHGISHHLLINYPFSDLFRLRAYEAWNIQKNEKLAIFYQTASFCLKCSSYRDCENEEIQCYIDQLQKEMNYQMSGNNIEKHSHFSQFDNANKYLEREIVSTCRNQFPKEWTVIQLSKNYNPNGLSSKYDEIVTFNTGLSMTIFKHSAVKDMLMIDVKKPTLLDNIFEKVYKLNKMIADNSQQSYMTTGQSLSEKEIREKYLKATQEIDVYVQDIINNLTSFLGPWICAMTGNFKSRKSIETENEIRKKVIEFLSTRNYLSEYQQKLIHLVARRTDLLSHQQIFVAITYILQDKSTLGYNDIDLNDLYDHLTWIKQEFKYDDPSTHPCILIVDELLDQMPFEMVNTQQEFTRICSFANLKRLWEGHNASIDINGHVLAPINNCQGIVNPDDNLNSMEERMKKFYNYWLPSWKVFYRNKPEDYNEMLSQCDVFVYSGHGSGLALLSDNVYSLKTKSVVFLFGCASTGLTSSGLNSELVGAHNYYHLGNSPCGKFYLLYIFLLS